MKRTFTLAASAAALLALGGCGDQEVRVITNATVEPTPATTGENETPDVTKAIRAALEGSAMAMETGYTERGTYDKGLAEAAQAPDGIIITPTVTTAHGAENYCLVGTSNKTGLVYILQGTTGDISVSETADDNCTPVAE